ncbi:hypothetical protein SERLA73DRAFT_178311 [Serpula lacrymans var. lacrymans S7.3]|uniref:Uncharacterized protein n=2 Tax=Serpula lacrymans var. lacrymans TaxID=341189 RepID=F8PRA2_SERL3|nr:hypothetical protein SERLA73DRAFT_178311 [Serpula lacrymans var. lacrymans S7.3]
MDDTDGDTTGDETIRFRNLRRSLDNEPSLEFEAGINADIQGTLRNALVPQHIPVPAAHMHKSRKSVVGLFDSPGSIDRDSGHQPPLSLTIPGLPIPFSTNAAETPTSSTSISPASVDVSPIEHTARTLDSELGSQIGEDWGFSAGNHHFRTSSLYNLTAITPAASSGSGFGSIRQPNPSFEELHSRCTTTTDMDTTVSADSHSQISSDETTPTLTDVSSKPMPSDDLLLPGTWRGQTPPIPPHIESQAEKKRRMSQTIRQRTTRWGEGRFTESLLTNRAPPRTDSRIEPDRPLTPIPQRLANVFDAVVETIAGGRESGEASPARSPTTLGRENGSAVTLRVSEVVKEERKGGIVSFVLEVWLWLQFVIIILVFLWAMAKRGPKSVLEDAERKKMGSR